jgi:hypothetical protein
MKLYVYSVFDKAVNAYMQPFFCRSTGEALRSFTDIINDTKTNFHQHYVDFSLYELGEFDDNTGQFDAFNETKRIVTGPEVLLIDDPVVVKDRRPM